jgi:glutamate-5-semialdehyde dehydrogenase
MENSLENILQGAIIAKDSIAFATSKQKNKALELIAKNLLKHAKEILLASQKDVSLAKENGLSKAMIDRLELNDERVLNLVKSVKEITAIKDPVGRKLKKWKRPNGLTITQVSVPIGVIGIIFESRPNVAIDASCLAIKSGNAIVLRGGSESFNSCLSLVNIIRTSLKQAGLDENIVSIVQTKDRAVVGEMLRARGQIDLIIPRGGKELIKRVIEESKIPTLEHLDGNCFTYIHENADVDTAIKVSVNAKMRRVGICGATESIVIDKKIADKVLPKLAQELHNRGCELRGDKASMAISKLIAKQASEEDYYTEYLDAIVSIKIVAGFNDALEFIKKHHSKHTDSIITESKKAAETFQEQLDSAIVMVNTSTQFADGGEFGFGAEIGIATGKMHARGPVGAEQLNTFKYLVESKGAVRK